MNQIYTDLGAVPGSQHDEMLARTGAAARAILAQIKTLPRNQQVAALDRVLKDFDPGLPARVRRVAAYLSRQGMRTNQAVERALTLSLADASIDRIKRLGESYRRGAVVPLGFLGTTLPAPETTSQERSAGNTVKDMFKGIMCSDGLQQSVTDMVGRKEGQQARDAANLGYEVAQGFSRCAPQAAPTPTPPAPPTPESGGSSLAVPIAIGMTALVVVGGVVWYTNKKN